MQSLKAFTTQIYHSRLCQPGARLVKDLFTEAYQLQIMDGDGARWCLKNNYLGYTSYGSMDQLHQSSPNFSALEKKIATHVRKYARELGLLVKPSALLMDSCWVNIMPKNAHHSMHIHPHSVISGTFYVAKPKGSAAIRFEDPRLHRMMASPLRKDPMTINIDAGSGELVLFESWLSHEVPTNLSDDDRISISFNYSL